MVVRGSRTVSIVPSQGSFRRDYATEYLDLILAAKLLKAWRKRRYIRYRSGPTDAIVTENYHNARVYGPGRSAAVNVNASRFTDDYQYGFGAEIDVLKTSYALHGGWSNHPTKFIFESGRSVIALQRGVFSIPVYFKNYI